MKNKSCTKFSWKIVDPAYVTVYENLEKKYKVYTTTALRLAEISNVSKGETAVDIGCGTGISTEVILNRIGKDGKAIGIDISPAMLKKAKEKLAHYKNVIFVQ